MLTVFSFVLSLFFEFLLLRCIQRMSKQGLGNEVIAQTLYRSIQRTKRTCVAHVWLQIYVSSNFYSSL